MPGSPTERFFLETERLRLRPLVADDVDHLLGIFSDPVAMQYYPGLKDRAETEQWIAYQIDSYARHGFGLWGVELREGGEFVGQCGLGVQEVGGRREVEVGYLLLRRHWGRGFATEAALACRDHGFSALGYTRLVSLIDPANQPSRRVAERIGMALEAQVEKWQKTVCVYSIEADSKGNRAS